MQSADDRTTQLTLEINGEEISNLSSFTYTSDVRQLGDPFSVEIPDPRRKWGTVVTKGELVKLYAKNPDVNNGTKTLKLTGRIRNVKQKSTNGQGRVLLVSGADLGWHLTKSSGPLWYNLQQSNYLDLLLTLIDESWGFQGVRTENDTSRRLKLGRAQAALVIQNNAVKPIQYIGIGPGETVAQVLTSAMRYDGLLTNVSADGYLQAWNPNYRQAPLYKIEYHDREYERSLAAYNVVQEVEVESDADPLFTHVHCMRSVLWQDPTKTSPNDPHPGQYSDSYVDTSLLPFYAPQTFQDGDQRNSEQGRRRAKWKSMQNQYEAWTYRCKVRGHHQRGVWWESDTMCTIDDTVNVDDKTGKTIQGNFYVASVQYSRTAAGDVTDLVLKRPGLLSAI